MQGRIFETQINICTKPQPTRVCLRARHQTRLQLERGARFVHERVQLRLVVIVRIARSLTFDSLELVQLMLHSTPGTIAQDSTHSFRPPAQPVEAEQRVPRTYLQRRELVVALGPHRVEAFDVRSLRRADPLVRELHGRNQRLCEL